MVRKRQRKRPTRHFQIFGIVCHGWGVRLGHLAVDEGIGKRRWPAVRQTLEWELEQKTSVESPAERTCHESYT